MMEYEINTRHEQSYRAPNPAVIHQHPHQCETGTTESAGTNNIPPAPTQPIMPMLIHEEQKDDYHYDDEEIQKDAASEMVAFMIHAALAFFMILFFGALVACILIVGTYGFLTLMLVGSLLCAVLTIGYFVSGLMDEDRVLKPVRRKIRRMHALATAVVVQEMRDFQLDMNEHLMLTNGDGDGDGDDDYGMMDENGEFSNGGIHEHSGEAHHGMPMPTKKKRRGPRSKVFAFLVKPFLKKKNGQKFKFKRKKEHASGTEDVAMNSENDDHHLV